MSDFDVIVVGGGPAGSIAAYESAKAGLKTIILEKDRNIGIPVRCGELVGEDGIEMFLKPDTQWISATITRVRLNSPNDTSLEVGMPTSNGLILDRKTFDFVLAQMAAQAGAEIQTRAYVDRLKMSEGKVTGVEYQHFGEHKSLSAKIVIGADGIESRVGRLAGLRTALKLGDTASGYQITAENVDVDQNLIDFYLGQSVAPSGYLWIFPKGEGRANIGLGVVGKATQEHTAKPLLDRFMAKRFPHASVRTVVAGGIPLSTTLKKITSHGLMLIGDAARMVNPVSGGGIIPGMISGRIAGQVAAAAIDNGDVSEKGLKAFPKRWHKEVGRNHERTYRISQSLREISDEQFNSMTADLKTLSPDKLSLLKIFTTATKHKPKILLDVTRAFANL